MEQQRSVHMWHMAFSPITLGRNFSLIMEVSVFNYLYDIRRLACLLIPTLLLFYLRRYQIEKKLNKKFSSRVSSGEHLFNFVPSTKRCLVDYLFGLLFPCFYVLLFFLSGSNVLFIHPPKIILTKRLTFYFPKSKTETKVPSHRFIVILSYYETACTITSPSFTDCLGLEFFKISKKDHWLIILK